MMGMRGRKWQKNGKVKEFTRKEDILDWGRKPEIFVFYRKGSASEI